MLTTIIFSSFLSIISPIKSCIYKTKEQIQRNNPGLDKLYVNYLSSLITKITKKYKLSCELYTAILMQESRYNLSAKNCHGGVCTDFGIGQIHIGSIKRYKFDKKKLLSDLEYSLEASARILSEFKKIHKNKPKWWTYYNGGNNKTRAKYFTLVSKWR